MRAQLTGAWGEAAAADYLRKRGYEIVSMGFRTRFGEIDIIAADGDYLVFAEVKTRSSETVSLGREAVDRRKMERIRKTALIWLARHETALQPRFDVIELYAPRGREDPEIRHLEDAFQ